MLKELDFQFSFARELMTSQRQSTITYGNGERIKLLFKCKSTKIKRFTLLFFRNFKLREPRAISLLSSYHRINSNVAIAVLKMAELNRP